MNSLGFLFGRSDPRWPLAFKIETKQQKPQEEKIPIQPMAALKISRKQRPRQHQPYNLPSWVQIKPLTNQAENLVSLQGMPQNPENNFVAMACFACFRFPHPTPPHPASG